MNYFENEGSDVLTGRASSGDIAAAVKGEKVQAKAAKDTSIIARNDADFEKEKEKCESLVYEANSSNTAAVTDAPAALSPPRNSLSPGISNTIEDADTEDESKSADKRGQKANKNLLDVLAAVIASEPAGSATSTSNDNSAKQSSSGENEKADQKPKIETNLIQDPAQSFKPYPSSSYYNSLLYSAQQFPQPHFFLNPQGFIPPPYYLSGFQGSLMQPSYYPSYPLPIAPFSSYHHQLSQFQAQQNFPNKKSIEQQASARTPQETSSSYSKALLPNAPTATSKLSTISTISPSISSQTIEEKEKSIPQVVKVVQKGQDKKNEANNNNNNINASGDGGLTNVDSDTQKKRKAITLSDDFYEVKRKRIKAVKYKAEIQAELDEIRNAEARRYLGVNYHALSRKFRSRIKILHKTTHLGYYETSQKAAMGYDLAAIQLRGESAKTNYLVSDYEDLREVLQSIPGSPRSRCLHAARLPLVQDLGSMKMTLRRNVVKNYKRRTKIEQENDGKPITNDDAESSYNDDEEDNEEEKGATVDE